jgi:hypothetical protein
MERKCIIIDDQDQTSQIEEIVRLGKNKGIEIDCRQFNIGATFREDLLTGGKIDINKVIPAYGRAFGGITFHLAAFDWDLSDENISGINIIQKFKEHRILPHTPKLLYSGLLKNEISSWVAKSRRGQMNASQIADNINTLIRASVVNFVDRTGYEKEIITILSKTDQTLDLIIEEELKKFPELVFKNSFINHSFNGRTYLEISKLLEESEVFKVDFKREIIQQVISYLTEKIQ